jgi:hypothetical protein
MTSRQAISFVGLWEHYSRYFVGEGDPPVSCQRDCEEARPETRVAFCTRISKGVPVTLCIGIGSLRLD